jgi:hypothetical protein
MKSSVRWDATQLDWSLGIDVSGQPVGPISKGQGPFKMKQMCYPETSVSNNNLRCVTPQKSEDLDYLVISDPKVWHNVYPINLRCNFFVT